MDEYGTPPPPATNRSIDVELSGQEIVALDLDTLDSDPQDYIDLLLEARGNATASMWARLACEYWKNGLLDSAEKVLVSAQPQLSKEANALIAPIMSNIQLARSRKAPKVALERASEDKLLKADKSGPEEDKDHYYKQAAIHMNISGGAGMNANDPKAMQVTILTRGIWQLATANLDEALKSFNQVLNAKPNNIIALLGKARVAYARKQFAPALRLFQQVLQLKPDAQPDPRIGIGLCYWSLEQKNKARMCWERSLEVNPNSWAACLLLGLEAINSSKNADDDDSERTENFIKGTKFCERAFKLNNRNAAAANALFDIFVQRGEKRVALKLAERTIQFSETIALFSAGQIHAAFLAQLNGSTNEATKSYTAALKSSQKNPIASIGLAQQQYKTGEVHAAIHTLETLMQPPNPQRPIEALVMLASFKAQHRPGTSASDSAADKQQARELLDPVLKTLGIANTTRTNGHHTPMKSRQDAYAYRKAVTLFGDDLDLLIEAAKLWQDEDRGKMRAILEEAVRLVQTRVEAGQKSEPRLLNNFGVLKHFDGQYQEAKSFYERALTEASTVEGLAGENMSTTVLYNLARVYEEQGEISTAREAYDKLLGRHPEYADAKVRQAQILMGLSRFDDAHELLKNSISAQKSNVSLRSALAHFLVSRNQLKLAKDFTTQTIVEGGGTHDVYSICAVAWVLFSSARENRDQSSLASADRRKNFLRAAEFYERALQYDPKCAMAAQGLAIIIAEDVLNMSKPAPGSSDEATRRAQVAREALDIFGRVRESSNDSPSVYVNMGHCHFVRDELDRAIESYETAAKRAAASDSGIDVTIIQSLCRVWYSKAIKDQSFVALTKALGYAQRSIHLSPNEIVHVYNLAMIEQKAAEMLLSIAPAKRKLKDLKRAIQHGAHAVKLFTALAAEQSSAVPYDRVIVDQRRKYGETLIRRGDEQVEQQTQYEAAQEARLNQTRERRQQDREHAEQIKRGHEEERRRKAEELAETRRQARLEAQALAEALKAEESDEEKRKIAKKESKLKRTRVEASAPASDDEGAVSGAGGAPSADGKKRRKNRVKKEENGAGAVSDEEEALFSGDEAGDERPKKRLQKKRVVRDDEDEELVTASAPSRKKQFKSKETISDSDEDMS